MEGRPGARWLILPSSITRTRSASTSASSTSWVTSRTVGLWALTRRLQQLLHLDARQRVERPKRLVGKQEFRFANQRSGQRCALHFAARQRVRPRLFAFGKADIGQRLAAFCRRSAGERCRPSWTLRITFSQGSSRESWNSTEDFREATTGRPSPTSSSRSANALSRVLLPDPLRPMRATNSPSAMSNRDVVKDSLGRRMSASAPLLPRPQAGPPSRMISLQGS